MNLDEIYTLDIETADKFDGATTFALEPWRLKQGKAVITSVAIAGPVERQIHERNNSINELKYLLKSLKGKEVWAHHAMFDIAWLIEATDYDTVRAIKWRDSELLCKWLLNSQDTDEGGMSFSLGSVVEYFIKSHPDLVEFLDIKAQSVTPGEDYEYWLKRGQLDARMTLELVKTVWKQFPESMVRAFMLEQSILVPVARSWINGLPLDLDAIRALIPKVEGLSAKIAKELGVSLKLITSPKQVTNYITNDLGLILPMRTPKGDPSSSKESLMLLHHSLAEREDPKRHIIKGILDVKQLSTLNSKYIQGAIKCSDYNGSNLSLSSPRIFGTYTGRFTYSNKVKKKNQVGLATHQLPRKGPIRKAIVPPPGYKVLELDGAAQEMRFMAHFSKDDHMVTSFNNHINLHSSMGAHICGDDYESFQQKFHDQDKETTNFRYSGKLLNLSCQYRISGKALSKKFFSNYQIIISQAVGNQYEALYRSRYPGVQKYWAAAIAKGRKDGYAETIAGRRFGLTQWSRNKWMTESSSINFPIQGSGSEHKVLAISYLSNKFPEILFALDLHDGLWFFIPEAMTDADVLHIRDSLNKLDFHGIWNCEHVVDFPFDAQLGTNFGNVKEL